MVVWLWDLKRSLGLEMGNDVRLTDRILDKLDPSRLHAPTCIQLFLSHWTVHEVHVHAPVGQECFGLWAGLTQFRQVVLLLWLMGLYSQHVLCLLWALLPISSNNKTSTEGPERFLSSAVRAVPASFSRRRGTADMFGASSQSLSSSWAELWWTQSDKEGHLTRAIL